MFLYKYTTFCLRKEQGLKCVLFCFLLETFEHVECQAWIMNLTSVFNVAYHVDLLHFFRLYLSVCLDVRGGLGILLNFTVVGQLEKASHYFWPSTESYCVGPHRKSWPLASVCSEPRLWTVSRTLVKFITIYHYQEPVILLKF
jgi:hypothetical protein